MHFVGSYTLFFFLCQGNVEKKLMIKLFYEYTMNIHHRVSNCPTLGNGKLYIVMNKPPKIIGYTIVARYDEYSTQWCMQNMW